MIPTIHFKTSMFDVTKEKENPFNPIYGLSLLEWLKEELKGKLELTEPDAEDWGWYSELEFEGNSYMIGSCALIEEKEDPTSELEWVLQVHKHRSIKEKLLGRNKMSDSDSCFVFFKKLFIMHPDINDVQVG
ncbi:MAG: hypothetical protein ACRBF0_18785 [Calditrichia bacterium]